MWIHDMALFGRIALAAGLGCAVGWEREGLRDPTGHVRGLTTAAAIWSVAAVGVIAGAARFVLATLLAALFLLVLEMPTVPLPKRLDPVRWAHRFTNDNPPSDGDREAG